MIEPDKKRLHEYDMSERPVRMDRKWIIGITIGIVIFVITIGMIFTMIFMMRKGLW